MWTIGRRQRVEGKKYRPIVRKIRYTDKNSNSNKTTKFTEEPCFV